jgi:hypothetical protein
MLYTIQNEQTKPKTNGSTGPYEDPERTSRARKAA